MVVFSIMIHGKLTCIRFHSQSNVVSGNALVLVLYGKLAHASFPSHCNVVVFGNALVLVI